jgi:hypothetical protein
MQIKRRPGWTLPPNRRPTTRTWLGALAFGLAAAAAAGPSKAAPPPDATFDLSLYSSGPVYGDLSAPGSTSANGCNQFGGCGRAMGAMSANMSATQSESGGTSNPEGEAGGELEIVYYFTVNGPAGANPVYTIQSAGGVTSSGWGQATSSIWVNGVELATGCSSYQIGWCQTTPNFAIDKEFSAEVGTVQTVELLLNAVVGTNGAGTFSAWIDPAVSLTPAEIAEGYALEFSPNVSQSGAPSAPEASTWAMMLVGSAALGFSGWQRRSLQRG